MPRLKKRQTPCKKREGNCKKRHVVGAGPIAVAKRHEDRIRAAIRLIDNAPELRTAQKKELIDALRLSLVTDVLERLEGIRPQATEKRRTARLS